MAQITWTKDIRHQLNKKHYATVNGKKFPTVMDTNVQRFPANQIIRDLVEAGRNGTKLDLNMIWIKAANGEYTKDEMHELYRLMGYSICGFAEVFEDDKIGSSMWKGKK